MSTADALKELRGYIRQLQDWQDMKCASHYELIAKTEAISHLKELISRRALSLKGRITEQELRRLLELK